MEKPGKESAERFFRECVVPLYSPNKPLKEMTPYEQGRYKEIYAIYSRAIDDYEKFLPSEDELVDIMIAVNEEKHFHLPCRGLNTAQAKAISARLRGEG